MLYFHARPLKRGDSWSVMAQNTFNNAPKLAKVTSCQQVAALLGTHDHRDPEYVIQGSKTATGVLHRRPITR